MLLMPAVGGLGSTCARVIIATRNTGRLNFGMAVCAYAQDAACASAGASGYKQQAKRPRQSRSLR